MKKLLKGLLAFSMLLVVIGAITYWQRAAVFRLYAGLPPFQSTLGDVVTKQLAMRDGVELATRIFLPEGDGPWPAVLIRDPYSEDQLFCGLLVHYGFACVHQDTRGRYDSGGDWYPAINERHDGLDTLDWLIQQPWQNDRIATYGGSYVGLVQWAMIDEMPEQVKTVVADISHGDWYRIVQRNGHFAQGIITDWALGLHDSEASLEEMAAQHPMVDSNAIFLKGKKQWYHDYITHPEKTNPYWNSKPYQQVRNSYKNTRIPVLMRGAWHDFFLDGQLEFFEKLPSRKESLLVVRNGSHGESTVVNLRDALGYKLNTDLSWLNRHLKDLHVDSIPESGYVLQNNLDDSRESFSTWPEPSSTQTLYLNALTKSKACDGGRMTNEPTDSADSVTYVYDPKNPVPSRGGSYHFGLDIVDQGNDLCDRSDVLSFGTPVFEKGFTILGSMRIALNVASDREDSAFTVKLQEKMADGRVLNIRDDITSLSFRSGTGSKLTYEAGSSVAVEFNLIPIMWELKPGSSLRLDISSSNYPIYNAHPNTDKLWSLTTESKTANQTLFAGELSIPVR